MHYIEYGNVFNKQQEMVMTVRYFFVNSQNQNWYDGLYSRQTLNSVGNLQSNGIKLSDIKINLINVVFLKVMISSELYNAT